jgi:glycerate 2-kinase
MSIKILVAPSGFKEGLGPDEVADCIAAGILHAAPDAKILKAPLVDGGEGFAKALVRVTSGTLHPVKVTGPIGQEVEAHFGFLGAAGPKTAVLEMAAAAGLRLVPRDRRDPLETTTYGVGELIKAALDEGAEKLVIGCGDSGTNDGGAGMAQALGVRLLDARGCEIGWGNSELMRLEHIDMSARDPRIDGIIIDVACNWYNVLCGPRGAARIFGPQKGAAPQTVATLEAALNHYADVIERELNVDVRTKPGSGASGGLGTGLQVFLNARLHPCYEIVMQYIEIDNPLREADLVITAEGCIDNQTPRGKIPAEIARRAKAHNLPVVALAGMIGQGAEENLAHGIDSYASIIEAPVSLSEAMATASEVLPRAAERMLRLIQVGQKVERSSYEKGSEFELHKPIEAYSTPPLTVNSAEDSESPLLNIFLRELRAPLAIIMGYTEMLKNGQLGEVNSEQERALRNIMRHSAWLVSIMNALFQSLDPQSQIARVNQSERVYADNWARQ